MYNDTIKVANKIISDADLAIIFEHMQEEILRYQKQYEAEKDQNEKYEFRYQNWTLKDYRGEFKCKFNFYDDTEVDVDNYNTFQTVFNNRLHEIKNMWIRYTLSYGYGSGLNIKYQHKSIFMNIYEDKMSIDVNLGSEDDKMKGVYDLIKEKVLTAPEKYDRVIKKKTSIINKVGLAIGLPIGIVIALLLTFVPAIRELYLTSYVLFPVIGIALAYFIGSFIANMKLDHLYAPLLPDKKYAGYDTYSQKSVYKDDIDKFVETSEIIIGKNVDNLKNRNEIVETEKKYSKLLPIELLILVGLSIIYIVAGIFLQTW